MQFRKFLPLVVMVFGLSATGGEELEGLDSFVAWLLEEPERLESVPFAEVVEAATGCKLLPVDRDDPVDRKLLSAVDLALAESLRQFGEAGDAIHKVGRVNEISGHVESVLRARLDAMEGLRCEIPRNASGDVQRSGYPDLRLLHEASGRVFYLDPKVFKAGSEDGSFRTFYFEPKGETNKILDDACHLIVGIAHGGKVDGVWRLKDWRVVDLATFRVRLKAEFQASNRDLYRSSAVLMESGRVVEENP